MIYLLDGNQEVIKIVRNSAVISAIQTQELPEDNSLLRDYLSVRLKNDERLFNAQYMAVKSYDGNRNAFDLYRIASKLVPDNATEFMGVQVAPYELEGVVIEDLRPQDRPLGQTMSQVLEGSDWRLGYISDNLPNVTTNFYYASVKDALKKIQELTNVEMLFKVEISGNKITDKWVEVYHQLGNRTMKRFNYGTNALSVVRESSHDELYTALIGRGKGEEVGETESGDATYGRKITFEDVEWKKSAGKPVDKPKGQKYIELPNATAEYGIKLLDGRKVPRIGIVEFSDTDDPNVLLNQTYQELLVRARPKVLFKASVINTGDMLIGDTVTIHRHDLGFHYQARVRKVVRDRRNNNKTQVEIGDVVHTPSTKRQGQINSALNNVASDLENVRGEITEARSSADGKNTNFYGNVEPDRKKVGDTWFRDHPSLTGESQILVWNGEAWELIMDTSETTKNAREIEKAMEEVEEAKQQAKLDAEQALTDAKAHADAEIERIDTELSTDIGSAIEIAEQAKADAVTKANQALVDAKAHAEEEDTRIKQEIGLEVDGAIEIAEQAKQDAVDKANQALIDAKAHADSEILQFSEHFDGVLAEVESDVANAQATADSAVEQIDTAVTNAGFTSLDETVQNMTATTMSAEESAQQAIDDASNAYGLAQTSVSEAQTAQQNSLDALGKADNALGGVSNLNVRVDEVEGELESKADNTFMNEDGTLTTLSNAITFNAYRFSSDMSRIESRVNSLAGAQNVLLNSHFKEKGKNWVRQTGTPIFDGETVVLNGLTEIYQRSVDIENGINAMFETRVKGTGTLVVRFGSGNEGIEVDVDETEFKDLHFVIEVSGNRNMIISSTSGNLEIDWVKLSTSQTETGWTPAIADTLTTAEIAIFRNEYDEFADKTERRLTTIDSEGGSLDVLSNEIITTAERVTTDMTALINTKVDDDEFTEFYQNEYLETAQEVSRKISLSDVEVGGVNRALEPVKRGFNIGNGLVSNNAYRTFTTAVLPVGKYIISHNTGMGVRLEPSANVSTGSGYSFTKPLRIEVTTESSFNVSMRKSDNSDIGDEYLTLDEMKFKIEKGNVATDWSPAPEDTDAKIDHIETEWTQTFDTFSQTVSGIDGRVTDQKQTIDGLETTIQSTQSDLSGTMTLLNQTKETVDSRTNVLAQLRTDVDGKTTISQFNTLSSTVDGTVARVGDAEGKITQIETNVNGLQTTVADKASQSEVTQLATGLSSVVTDLSNLEVGGVNVLKGTKDLNTDNFVRSGSITIRQDEDIPYLRSSGSSADYYIVELEPSATYTLSLDIRNFVSGNSSLLLQWFSSLTSTRTSFEWADIPNANITSEWKRFNVTFTVPTNNNFFSLGFRMADFRLFKLEKGNKATDWTPAPEDIATQSQISQLSDNINLRVKEGDVISQINIEADRTLIQSNRLVLDANSVVFTGSAFIPSAQIESLHANKINAGTINSERINATEIVAQGLTVNVIEATHIDTSTATIDKLFANETMINQLTSKTAFINSIKAVEIDAGKITSGTISAARLDTQDIVTKGLTANVIKSTHVETSTATIDKLFATDAMVNTLTAKTAFINSIKAVEIDASKITSGTINTARLNATDIVTEGLEADVIKSTHILADTALFDKLFTSDLATDRLSAQTAWIKNGMFANASIDGAKIQDATIGSAKIAELDAKKITTGKLEGVEIVAERGYIAKFDIVEGSLSSRTSHGYTTVKGDGDVAFATSSPQADNTSGSKLQIWHDGTLRFDHGGQIRFQRQGGEGLHAATIRTTVSDNLLIESWKYINIIPHNTVQVDGHINPYVIGGTWALGNDNYRWRNVYLQFNPNVSSDARFKANIQDIPEKLLEKLKEVKPRQYEMDGTTHFGYIAQDVERALYKYAVEQVGYENAREYMDTFDLLGRGESYLSLIYAEIAVLKDEEQNKRIEVLENRIKELENAS